MKKNPLFTIIIFVENEEKYLDDFFCRILNQTYKNIEVVFVDNNSYDLSFEKAVEYSQIFQQSGMSLQIEKNKKKYDFSNNVSLASKKIEGNYIVYLSARDRIAPNYVEKVVEKFEKNVNVGAVLCSQNYICDGRVTKASIISKDMNADSLRESLVLGEDFSKAQIVRRNALGGIIAKYSVTINCYKHIYDLFITSCLADIAVVDEVLVDTEDKQDLLPEEEKMIMIFERYSMLLAFQTKARVLLNETDDDKIKCGIKNLAKECVKMSECLKERDNEKLSKKYARLAMVFDSSYM